MRHNTTVTSEPNALVWPLRKHSSNSNTSIPEKIEKNCEKKLLKNCRQFVILYERQKEENEEKIKKFSYRKYAGTTDTSSYSHRYQQTRDQNWTIFSLMDCELTRRVSRAARKERKPSLGLAGRKRERSAANGIKLYCRMHLTENTIWSDQKISTTLFTKCLRRFSYASRRVTPRRSANVKVHSRFAEPGDDDNWRRADHELFVAQVLRSKSYRHNCCLTSCRKFVLGNCWRCSRIVRKSTWLYLAM